ncbi:BolA family transcriptional regulator [Lysobacter pythonis]|uniref:BolA family transcriptional regulator n=2 Tax=Solilutibacter pythonis TaxID=2483112 RepID=A0A3M2I305_9GAMM|nr:BolA family protein [Lysobacter pythonis]RMH94523.1 BolA family transcriptional regulator [Lysobacter pythonis]
MSRTEADIPRLNPGRIERMRELLGAAFAPTELDIRDDSHKHAGHGGGAHGHGHFSVRIVSARFAGMTPLARHRAVYAALGEMMREDIHALAIEARAPA